MDNKVPKFPSRRKSGALVTYTLLIKVKCILFILENCALMDLKGRKEGGVWGTQKIFRFINLPVILRSVCRSYTLQNSTYPSTCSSWYHSNGFCCVPAAICYFGPGIPNPLEWGWVSLKPSPCLVQTSLILLPCLGQEIYFHDPNSLCFAFRIK